MKLLVRLEFNEAPSVPILQFGQVVVVWMLDTVHQGLVSHSGYIYMVSQYGNVSFLFHVEASLEVRELVHYAV